MPVYKIYTCDTLPDGGGGYEINDMYNTGHTLTVDHFKNDEKIIFVDALKEHGLLSPHINNRYLDIEEIGQDDFIVRRSKDGRQLYQFACCEES